MEEALQDKRQRRKNLKNLKNLKQKNQPFGRISRRNYSIREKSGSGIIHRKTQGHRRKGVVN